MDVAAISLATWLLAQLGGSPTELPQGPVAPALLQPAAAPREATGRTSPIPPPRAAQDAAPSPGWSAADAGTGAGRNRPDASQMVAEALSRPANGPVAGQPLTVLQALSAIRDRGRQLEIMLAYWRLVEAVAVDHFCHQHVEQLSRLSGGTDEPVVRAASAAASARLREAELEAVDVQYRLAALLGMSANAPLPLPADRPYVGPYRTGFPQVFAGRTAPERTRLLARVLPIWQQAIDERAAAVQAAEEASSAVSRGPGSAADASARLVCSRDLFEQRRALIRAVCEYNRDIAAYALAVARLGASPRAITAMLIGPPQTAATPAVLIAPASNGTTAGKAADSAVQPAALNEPVQSPDLQSLRSEPTLAAPRTVPASAPPTNEPVWAPRGSTLKSDAATPHRASTATSNEMLIWPEEKPETGQPATQKAELVPVRPQAAEPPSKPAEPKEWGSKSSDSKPLEPEVSAPKASRLKSSGPQSVTANKPTLVVPGEKDQGRGNGHGTMPSAAAASPLYAGLMAVDPLLRAKELTIALHWDRSLPAGAGTPMTLRTSLMRSTALDPRTTIEAYWRLRQQTARYQMLAERVEWLESLRPAVVERRGQPVGPLDLLRLRAAETAAKAAASEAQAGLTQAQYALASHTGAVVEAAWPLAATPPHAGSYLLRLELQPRDLVGSWAVRRLAAKIPALGDSLQRHATAVVETDAARSSAVQKYLAGGGSLAAALESIRVQTEQTAALLAVVTDYNLAIADYALAVLPPGTPADKLVASLVVSR